MSLGLVLHIDGLVQESRNSSALAMEQWSYVFLALTHLCTIFTVKYAQVFVVLLFVVVLLSILVD